MGKSWLQMKKLQADYCLLEIFMISIRSLMENWIIFKFVL